MRFVPATACALIATIGLGAGGCATKRTIPPTDGKASFDTSIEPVPELCVLAINEGHARSSFAEESIVYNLPSGLRRETWLAIDRRLPETAQPMHPGDTRVVSVEELRIDGGRAEVDVLVPRGTQYQLYTLHLRGGGLGGWKVTYAQPWTLRTDAPVTHNPWAGEVRPSPAASEVITTGSEPAPNAN